MTSLDRYSRYIFESVSAFGAAVRALDSERKNRGSEANRHDNPFTLEEAIAIAADRGGHWPDGAEGIQSVKLDPGAAKKRLKRALRNDVVGAIPNVPAYLAGHPLNMISVTKTPNPKKFLKLGVHIGGSGGTRQSTRLNRGKAIMAIVDALEDAGYSVEVWALWRNSSPLEHASVEVCLKQSSAVWNAHTAAFALANTSFQRRLCWRFIESSPSAAIAPGFGRGVSAPHDDFDLWFPYVTGAVENSLRTPQRALDYAVDIAKKALNSGA